MGGGGRGLLVGCAGWVVLILSVLVVHLPVVNVGNCTQAGIQPHIQRPHRLLRLKECELKLLQGERKEGEKEKEEDV